jgi:hypothetical protein
MIGLPVKKTFKHIRGPDGQAFPLPSRRRPASRRKTAMGGGTRIDSIGFPEKRHYAPSGGSAVIH